MPHRSNSFILPTVNCLVELTEMPFTVITLGGVWVASGGAWGEREAAAAA